VASKTFLTLGPEMSKNTYSQKLNNAEKACQGQNTLAYLSGTAETDKKVL
jgi:hypothetical protein